MVTLFEFLQLYLNSESFGLEEHTHALIAMPAGIFSFQTISLLG